MKKKFCKTINNIIGILLVANVFYMFFIENNNSNISDIILLVLVFLIFANFVYSEWLDKIERESDPFYQVTKNIEDESNSDK